jgi:hypothetical protein
VYSNRAFWPKMQGHSTGFFPPNAFHIHFVPLSDLLKAFNDSTIYLSKISCIHDADSNSEIIASHKTGNKHIQASVSVAYVHTAGCFPKWPTRCY